MNPTRDPPDFDDWDSPDSVLRDRPIRDRLQDVVLQLREPTTVAAVAERADCDTETARDYLEWFASAGIVREHEGRPVRYERNESYLRWRRIEEIRAEYTDAEIVDELEATLDELREYRARFDADHPDDVSLLAVADRDGGSKADPPTGGDGIETVWEALSKWQTIRRRAEYLDAARRDEFGDGRHRGRIDA